MRAIAALALASFASQALVRAADTLLPQIASDFAISVGAASIVITAYALTHGSMQFITGPIADRFGKYRTVAIACAVSAGTVALCGLASSLDSLTLARFASGITVAWILPISLAYIGDVVPYEQRQQLLGRFLAAQVLGQMFGQAAGGIVGDYFTGGLIYAATVKPLMRRLGQTGIANTGGALMGLSFLTLAIEPVWHLAPLATLGIGLGFFMLHNTLQTEGTQMTPEARGTSVALFASMYFIGQTVGVALAAPVMDRYGAAPLFLFAAAMLPALAFWFTRRLKLRR